MLRLKMNFICLGEKCSLQSKAGTMLIVEWVNRNLLGSEGSPLSLGSQNIWHFHNMKLHILHPYWLSFILHFKWRIPHFKSSQLSKLLSFGMGTQFHLLNPRYFIKEKRKKKRTTSSILQNEGTCSLFLSFMKSETPQNTHCEQKKHNKNCISENKWEKQDLQQLSQSEGFALWGRFCYNCLESLLILLKVEEEQEVKRNLLSCQDEEILQRRIFNSLTAWTTCCSPFKFWSLYDQKFWKGTEESVWN